MLPVFFFFCDDVNMRALFDVSEIEAPLENMQVCTGGFDGVGAVVHIRTDHDVVSTCNAQRPDLIQVGAAARTVMTPQCITL